MTTLRWSILALVASLTLATPAPAQSNPIDFVSLLLTTGDSGRTIGLHKLSAAERAQLNRLLNAIYELGRTGTPQQPSSPNSMAFRAGPTPPSRAYVTKIESDSNDILKLANGATIEITGGYLGYVGYRRDAVLILTGPSCRIWIKDKRVYRCSSLRAPDRGGARSAVETAITEVTGDGTILKLLDGSIFQVDPLYTIYTALWLPTSAVLLLDDAEMINLDQGDELITVTRIK